MNILKSIGAVLVGFVAVAALSVATDAVLEKLGILPSAANPELTLPWMLAMALAYRSVFTVIGGYVTARLAPFNVQGHVWALVVLGGIGGVAGAISGWSLGNHWYPVALAVTGPVFVWLGGQWYVSRHPNQG